MKRAKTTMILTILALAVGTASAAMADDKGCSNVSLKGNFDYSSTGTLLPSYAPPPFAGPFAEIGLQSFDGNGNTSGSATLSANGNIVPVTFTGTYSVNSDCTGNMTLQISPLGATVHVDFVIDKSGKGFQAIETEPGLIVTRTGSRMSSDNN